MHPTSNLRDGSISSDGSVVIGIVNNMPDAALQSTERQFHDLLAAAAQGRVTRLRHFSLPGITRSEAAHVHIAQHYEDLNELWGDRLDGLIVTGTEPLAAELSDEPYWGALTKLIDWSEERTISTVWSCLAAHAAVLHRDGIKRRRLPEKLFGIFACDKAAEHAIGAGATNRWSVPHSRHNDLSVDELITRGYEVLSGSDEVGADMFVKERGSLEVFFQGHPEYDADALSREYRRDVARFLMSESGSYPEMPRGYFDHNTVKCLTEFRQHALANRDPKLLQRFPLSRAGGRQPYSPRSFAVRLYANWIALLTERKSKAAMEAGRGR